MATKQKPKINGRLVLKALEDLQEPSSAFTVTTYVGALVGINPYDIKKFILDLLDIGLRFGYISKYKNLYYIPQLADVKQVFKKQKYVTTDRRSAEY